MLTQHDGEQGGRTPERLRAFRNEEGESAPGLRVVIVAAIALLVGVAFGFVGLRAIERDPRLMPAVRPGGLSVAQLRRLAISLDEGGLPLESLAVYERFLEEAPLNDQSRAATSLHMARIASLAGEHERALRYAYQADLLNDDPDLQGSIDALVLDSLEALGRNEQLARELQARSAPDDTGAPEQASPAQAPAAGSRGTVVARLGSEVISLAQFRAYKQQLPPSRMAEYANGGGDAALLRDAVAERMLLRRGVRDGLHQSPDVQARLNNVLNRLVVREAVDRLLAEVPEPSEEEARRFYDENPGLFTEVDHVSVRVTAAGTPDAPQDEWVAEPEPVAVRLEAREDSPFPEPVRQMILDTAPGGTTEPVELGGRFYRFEVLSREDGGVRPFDEVRDRAVALAWQAAKEARFEAYQEELLSGDEVQLYPDRLAAPADATDEDDEAGEESAGDTALEGDNAPGDQEG